MIDSRYGGDVVITGKNPYPGGNTATIYAAGAQQNIANFYDQIAGEDWSNATVAPSVRSNLTCVLGRTAAYQKREVTWTELLRNAERLEADLSGLKS